MKKWYLYTRFLILFILFVDYSGFPNCEINAASSKIGIPNSCAFLFLEDNWSFC